MTNLDSTLKKQRHYFTIKTLHSQSYGFSSSHMWMCKFDHKESWVPKNGCFWTVVLEKNLESPLDCKNIQPVNSEYLLEGLTLKLKFQYFRHLMQRTDSLEMTLDAEKVWRQEEKGTKENEMVGWHHRLNGHESEYTLGVGDGQGGLACCSPWGRKELDLTEQLNWTGPLQKNLSSIVIDTAHIILFFLNHNPGRDALLCLIFK